MCVVQYHPTETSISKVKSLFLLNQREHGYINHHLPSSPLFSELPKPRLQWIFGHVTCLILLRQLHCHVNN